MKPPDCSLSCSLDKDEISVKMPSRSAADNCTKAVGSWQKKAAAAVKAGEATAKTANDKAKK